MELGKKIYQLRKLSGMTQEQLSEKLNISRQTLSKWENGTGMPDVESVVRLSVLFQTSLEELLLEKGEEADFVEKKGTQITLEDMVRINVHNRRMNLLLCSGFLFLAIGILLTGFERMLESAAVSLEYILYRYMVTGNYEAAPMNYGGLLIPAILAGAVGVVLCLCYIWGSRKR
ncbi:XRE family transcriptional regulator [bacterium 1XD8-76]|nr:XRE family transcriptional regulator [bacterium 1XD8-76]